ncbi:MAG: hypothetical protein ACLQHL_13200 [Candidatus Cybelea sp.]
MKILKLAAMALLLSACASNTSVPSTSGGGSAQPGNQTFEYTGKEQSFSVPARVTKIMVVALGAMGGGHNGGRGGRTTATISVTPGDTLAVFVGGEASGTRGGFNGGGPGLDGGHCSCAGYGGGGASDVRAGGDALGDRILIAAGAAGEGGGNGSAYGEGEGGGGGGFTGGLGGGGPYNFQNGGGGFGGTQTAGGSGAVAGTDCDKYSGTAGTNGALRNGGSGGAGGKSNGHSAGGGGGGGGGGYYGGGGGGGGCGGYTHNNNGGGGGGGGSSYIDPTATGGHTWTGWKTATTNGEVVFSWQ